MARLVKQAILVAFFALPLAAMTVFGITALLPMFLLFDWIDNEQPNFGRTLEEILEPWCEFVSRVRTVS
jgi:hypothetical protein